MAIERYRGQFTAALPTCGVLGANRLFDYFLGANATAFALTGAPLEYPDSLQKGTEYTPEFARTVHEQVMPGLGIADPPGQPGEPALDTAAESYECTRAGFDDGGVSRSARPGTR